MKIKNSDHASEFESSGFMPHFTTVALVDLLKSGSIHGHCTLSKMCHHPLYTKSKSPDSVTWLSNRHMRHNHSSLNPNTASPYPISWQFVIKSNTYTMTIIHKQCNHRMIDERSVVINLGRSHSNERFASGLWRPICSPSQWESPANIHKYTSSRPSTCKQSTRHKKFSLPLRIFSW